MVSINTFEELESFLQSNQSKINILHGINSLLNERYEIKSKYDTLKNELKSMQETETKRINDYEKQKQKELIDLEHLGQDLCQEHSKLMHQIEHINWHLGNVHPHDVATPIELPSHQHSSSSMAVATFGHGHNSLQCNNKSSANLGYLQISAERYVKSIAELRHKICLSKHNLEVEIERKRMAEKNLGDLRREVSKQKKLISMRRCVPLPSISTGKKCVK